MSELRDPEDLFSSLRGEDPGDGLRTPQNLRQIAARRDRRRRVGVVAASTVAALTVGGLALQVSADREGGEVRTEVASRPTATAATPAPTSGSLAMAAPFCRSDQLTRRTVAAAEAGLPGYRVDAIALAAGEPSCRLSERPALQTDGAAGGRTREVSLHGKAGREPQLRQGAEFYLVTGWGTPCPQNATPIDGYTLTWTGMPDPPRLTRQTRALCEESFQFAQLRTTRPSAADLPGPAVDRGYERVSWRGLSFEVPQGGETEDGGQLHPATDGVAGLVRWPGSDGALIVVRANEGVKLDPARDLGGLEGLYDAPCTARQVSAKPVVIDGVRGTYSEFECVPGSAFGPSASEVEPDLGALWVFPTERVVITGTRGDATTRRVAESVRFGSAS